MKNELSSGIRDPVDEGLVLQGEKITFAHPTNPSKAMHENSLIFQGERAAWHSGPALGHGRFGSVLMACDTSGRKAALKCLNAEFAEDAIAAQRLLRELVAMRDLQHPAFPVFLDQGFTNERAPFFAMEYLEGETLDKYWNRERVNADLASVFGLADQSLAAIEFAHDHGWLHRDISPRNLFVTRSRELKILDFGLCRAMELSGVLATMTGPAMLGTPGFVAPEQARGDWSHVDERADLWSLGAIFFLLLSGETVHPGNLDAQLRAVVSKPRVHLKRSHRRYHNVSYDGSTRRSE